MKSVLLVGTYNSRNKGDAAMQLTAAQQVLQHVPGVRITLSSPFPEIDAPFYHPLPVVRSNRRRLIWATMQLMRAGLWTAAQRRLERDLPALLAEPEVCATRDADLVLDLSGDMMTEDYGPHVAYSHFLPVLLAHALRRPYALCAQSIGPFQWTRPVARRILADAAWITVRDEITLDYVRGLGIRAPRVEFTADLAFLLEPASSERIDELLAAERVSFDEGPVLGVSVSQLIESHYAKHNPHAAAQPLAELIARVLDEVVARSGCQVLFVSHVTGPSRVKDDRIISRAVRAQMTEPAHVLEGDYDPRELKGVIRRCHAFVGARMHANIAALSSEVPVVALSYSHKTPGIMRLLGQEDLVCPIAELDRADLLEKVADVLGHREERAHTLAERLPAVRARASRNIELVVETLGC